MKRTLILGFCLLLGACGTTQPQQKGYGFGPSNYAQSRAASPATPTRAVIRRSNRASVPQTARLGPIRATLPVFQAERSATSRQPSLRVAARAAMGVGSKPFQRIKGAPVISGKYALELRHVRYGARDFIIAEQQGFWVKGWRNIGRDILPTIRANTPCEVRGDYFSHNNTVYIFPLSC